MMPRGSIIRELDMTEDVDNITLFEILQYYNKKYHDIGRKLKCYHVLSLI